MRGKEQQRAFSIRLQRCRANKLGRMRRGAHIGYAPSTDVQVMRTLQLIATFRLTH
jgi:hypothetical protein